MIAAVLAAALCLIGVAFANVSMTDSTAYAGNKVISGFLCMASMIMVFLCVKQNKHL